MFDSVLDRGVVPRGRLGTGVALSVLGHAGVLSLALMARPPAPKVEPPEIVKIVWPNIHARTTSGPALTGGGDQPRPRRKAGARRPTLEAVVANIPTKPPPSIPQEPREEEEVEVAGRQADTTSGEAGESASSSGLGEKTGSGGPGGSDGCAGEDCEIASGTGGPILLDRGRDPEYTREALEARVEGLMRIQCVVSVEGRLERCRIRRSLPHMTRAVLEALATRRYDPATVDGVPVPVLYSFDVRLVLPH